MCFGHSRTATTTTTSSTSNNNSTATATTYTKTRRGTLIAGKDKNPEIILIESSRLKLNTFVLSVFIIFWTHPKL